MIHYKPHEVIQNKDKISIGGNHLLDYDLKLAYLITIAIGIGAIGCEWTWNQQAPRIFIYPFYAAAMFIICFVALRADALVPITDYTKKWFFLIGWFFTAIIMERISATETHMPFDNRAQLVLFCYILAALCWLIGLRLGMQQIIANRVLDRAAFVLAFISLYIFFIGTSSSPIWTVFPSRYVSFPMSLICMFSFCWYLDKWLLEDKYLTYKLIGLLISSLPVLVAFVKPIFTSGLVCIILILILRCCLGNSARIIKRFSFLLSFGIVLFVTFDICFQGEISEHFLNQFYNRFLRVNQQNAALMSLQEILESGASGRYDIWDEAFQSFLKSPIFGTGLGQRSTFLEFALSNYLIPLHNGYLDMLISVGLFGTAPVIIAAMYLLKIAIQKLPSAKNGWIVPVLAYLGGTAFFNSGGTSNFFIFQSSFLLFCLGMVAAPIIITEREGHISGNHD